MGILGETGTKGNDLLIEGEGRGAQNRDSTLNVQEKGGECV